MSPSATLPRPPDPPPPPRGLSVGGYGLSMSWIERKLGPLLQRYSEFVHYRALEDAPSAVSGDGPDWDVLFIGSSVMENQPASLEAMVRRVTQAHALEVVIAVLPGESEARQLDLVRAGALDVLTMDASADQMERTFDYAIATAQARRQQVDSEKLQIITHLAVSVNHEINNPLAGLMGTAELMIRDNPSLDDKARRDLQTIMAQCRRIQDITARLKHLNHLRTIPYGQHDRMLDLGGELMTSPWTGGPPSQTFLETPRLLVVDDNPLIVDLIARLFDQKYEVEAATCASDALSKLERGRFDLILIDLILPEMNGLELYRAIRRVKPQQKALLTTAYQGDARVEQALHEGALGCVYKPFQLEELEKALDGALKKN